MRLHVPDFIGVDARSLQGCGDGRLLRFFAGDGDAVGVAVLRYRCAQYLRVDFVAVAQRLLKRLDDDDSATFSSCVTVGGFIECLAAPVGTEKPTLGFRDSGVGADHDVDAAGKREIAFAVPNAQRRKVYRDKRA